MDNQITYNEALIDERDQGIAEISQQIGEVNEIFQASCQVQDVLKNSSVQSKSIDCSNLDGCNPGLIVLSEMGHPGLYRMYTDFKSLIDEEKPELLVCKAVSTEICNA